MTIEELQTEMQAGFKKVDEEFVAIRGEMQSGFQRVDEQFARVDDQFTALGTEMNARFGEMNARFAQMNARFERVDERIATEGVATRRHFDVVAEGMKDLIRVVAEATAQNTLRLDDHEKRLTKLEQPRE